MEAAHVLHVSHRSDITIPYLIAQLTRLYSLKVVSDMAVANGIGERLSLGKEVAAVVGTRHVSKADMVRNNTTPDVSINPETFEVVADGKRLWCDPLDKVPLAQKYFFF
jgi:urease alpha subunit